MPPTRNSFRPALLLALVVLAVGPGAASASASVRFAAPGGTGTAPCAEREHPCSLFVAADQSQGAVPGDEIVLAPGTYVDAQGDMGPQHAINLPPGIQLHGEPGAPRPLLAFVASTLGRLGSREGDVVSGLEIVGAGAASPLMMSGGLVEKVLVTSEGGGESACRIDAGVLRDSACVAEGGEEAALSGISNGGAGTIRLRNVTAVASGPESFGIRIFAETFFSPVDFEADAKSVIAQGRKFDVEALAFKGAAVRVSLDHSDYRSITQLTDDRSTATVSRPGSGSNVTEPAKLAKDNVHQLADSPTVDRGGLDESSGVRDVDGQGRVIALVPDIGADEFILSTATVLRCSPSVIDVGAVTTCTATVSNAASPVDPPAGEVEFGASGGAFQPDSCALQPVSASRSSCVVRFGTNVTGAFLAFAEFLGDLGHSQSSDLTTVSAPGKRPPPNTRLRRLSARRGSNGTVRFSFASDQRGATFQCSLDRSGFRPCKSPAKISVKSGRHVFRVRAVSREHVQDPTPAVVRWRAPAARRHGRR